MKPAANVFANFVESYADHFVINEQSNVNDMEPMIAMAVWCHARQRYTREYVTPGIWISLSHFKSCNSNGARATITHASSRLACNDCTQMQISKSSIALN